MLRSFRMPALALGLFLLLPTVASANTYLVSSCHDPLGQPNAALGWVGAASGDGAAPNTCAANGFLTAALNSDAPSGTSSASWHFTAPAGTTVVRVLANRTTTGFGPGGNAQDVAYLMTVDEAALERCQPANDLNCSGNLTAPLDKQGLKARDIEFRVLCPNGGRPCTKRVGVAISNVLVALEDPFPPVVANARVLDDGDISGTLRVDLDAADLGGGLYRALVKVDGRITQAIPLGPMPCADVNPSDADPYQFNVPVPCPPLVKGAGATIDVRKLTPGPHGVEIAVEDASGNQATAYGPVEFPKANVVTGSSVERAEALTGRLRMWFVKAKRSNRRRYTSIFGNRVVTRGVLRTSKGRGIVGARIDV